MDEALADILKGHGGGVFAPLLVLSLLALVWMGRLLAKSYAANNSLERQHYEKRLDESAKLLVTLERNNTTNATLSAASEARAEAFNEMVRGFAVLVQTTEAGRERAREHATRVESELRELRIKAEHLQRTIGNSSNHHEHS